MKSTATYIICCIICICRYQTVTAQDKIKYLVYFQSDASTLEIGLEHYLINKLATFSSDDSLHIILNGHCDDHGSDAYNDILSLKRAEHVKELIIKKTDLNASYELHGYGEKFPLVTDDFEVNKFQNRRVEVCIIQYNTIQGHTESDSLTQSIRPFEYTVESGRSFREIFMSLKPGEAMVLRDVQFPMSSDSILPSSFPTLDSLAAILAANEHIKIQLEGHICCTTESGMYAGFTDAYNSTNGKYTLSTDRAVTVFMYLVYKGIPSNQMKYVGRSGKQKLVSPEKTAYDQQINRRVEVRILEN